MCFCMLLNVVIHAISVSVEICEICMLCFFIKCCSVFHHCSVKQLSFSCFICVVNIVCFIRCVMFGWGKCSYFSCVIVESIFQKIESI
jgi:hypothetical protein